MFKPSCLVPGREIEELSEDFRGALRVEQYRVGKLALYLPAGLRWNYIPLSAISRAAEAHRVINAGHCVTVREKRPTLDLETEAGPFVLNLEKAESLPRLLSALGAAQ